MYPYSIENGAGNTLHFLGLREDESGKYLLLSNELTPGSGPIAHRHKYQREELLVQEGKLAIQIEGQPISYHGPGERVAFEPGVVHRFWNAGDSILKCEGRVYPPMHFEGYLNVLYESMKENGGKPSIWVSAYLHCEFIDDTELTAIPGFVRNVLFPFFYRLGKLLGKFRNIELQPMHAS